MDFAISEMISPDCVEKTPPSKAIAESTIRTEDIILDSATVFVSPTSV